MDRPDLSKTPTSKDKPDRYRVLFENSPDPLMIMEGDRFTDCNLAAVRMFGFSSKSEIIDRHPSEISPEYQPDGRLSADKADEILSRTKDEPYQRFEWTHVRSDGSLFPVEVALLSLPGKDGPVLHTSLRDISARKQLEKELRHSQKMDAIGKLAGGIAHDINNQLVPIIGYADMLAERLSEDDEARGWALDINRAAGIAAVVIRKLLTISRKEQGELVTIELGDAVSSLLGMLAKLIGDDISIEFKGARQPLWVRTGAGDIEQILLNLASNSRDAMPRGGVLTVALAHVASPNGEYAHLHISDDGIGMDDETLASVFEPFFTTKALGAGTGLGLSTVFDLVRDVGGTIEASSEPGRGAAFDIHFPISRDLPATDDRTETRAARHPAPPAQRGYVLVVEDNAMVARFAKEVLESRGHRVALADDARKGLEQIDMERPNLILSDVIMPGFSGPQMIDGLEKSGIRIPVVFMSGYTDDRLARAGFDPSEVSLIRKPFSAAELIDTIESALGASKRD